METHRKEPTTCIFSTLEGLPPEEATWESANQFDQEDLKQLLARDAPPEELSNKRGRSL